MPETKYPKTWHLPWSESNSSDDHWHTSGKHFDGREVVVTEKLDGENWTMMRHKAHCRSLDSAAHPSQDWARRHWGEIRHNIPEGWRVCTENVYALHSIYYRNLPHYLFVIGIYDEDNFCLSWDDTVEYAELLDLPMPPVIYRALWDENRVRSAWTGVSAFDTFTEASVRSGGELVPTTGEGYVVRRADRFHHEDFAVAVSKFVRASHVQTTKFWRSEEIIPNQRDRN